MLDKDNLNRAYKRVKVNKRAPGINGMTIEAELLWLKETNRFGYCPGCGVKTPLTV